jgi:hypothetical protein
MPHFSGPAVDPPGIPPVTGESAQGESPPAFPAARRVRPLFPFAERWQAKREDCDRFIESANTVREKFRDMEWLPDAVINDWLASWAEDLFTGVLPRHDQLNPEQVGGAVADIEALLFALRFVRSLNRRHQLTEAQRVWFYELPGELEVGDFPTIDDVKRFHPDWDPREGADGQPGDVCRSRRYDQAQFLETARFLLGTPSAEQMTWLRCLAYRPDPLQPIWKNPPRHLAWAQENLREAIPAISTCLGIEYPEIDDTISLEELIRRVHAWVLTARPELTRRRWGTALAVDQTPAAEEDNRLSKNGSQASSSDGEVSPAGEVETSAATEYTLGLLILELTSSEEAYAFNRARADEIAHTGSMLAASRYLQAAVLRWQPNPDRMPGIGRIEVLCDLEQGEAGITVVKVRRLRARICQRLRVDTQHVDAMSLVEAADVLEGVQRASLDQVHRALSDASHNGLTSLDVIYTLPGEHVQVTGLSCKIIPGTIPNACPDACPTLPPSFLPLAEQAIRQVYRATPLPIGTTIHWVGHDTGARSRCRCPEYQNAPYAAPFDQPRWASVATRASTPAAETNDITGMDAELGDEPDGITGPTPTALVRRVPPDLAIKAYRLKFIRGVPKQTEIADLLSKEEGRAITQGQVSRWLRQAEEFVRLGGILPDMISPIDQKPISIDPERLDLGPRKDGHSLRQRGKRSDDGDDD